MAIFDGQPIIPKPSGGFVAIEPASLKSVGPIEAGMVLHQILNRIERRLGRQFRLDVENARRIAARLTMAHLQDVDFVNPIEKLEILAALALRSGFGMDDLAAALSRAAMRRDG